MTPRPHDALFRSAFEAPTAAAALVRDLLPPEVRDAIAWDTLKGENASYIQPALPERHSDLLFAAQLHAGTAVRIYLLLEHQSTGDPTMPLRTLAYETRIWQRFLGEHSRSGTRIPPIIAVIISHVPGGWATSRSLDDMFDPAVVAIPQLAALLPRFSLLIEDLAHLSNEDLQARSLAAFQKLTLWLLRDARDPARLLASFDTWARTMMQVLRAPSGIEAFTILLTYMFRVIGPVNRDDLHAKIRHMGPHAEETAMSIADQLHEEGRHEGRVTTIRSLLLFKFQLSSLDPRYDARLRTATPEAIDRYLQRVLIADSLAAVFDD